MFNLSRSIFALLAFVCIFSACSNKATTDTTNTNATTTTAVTTAPAATTADPLESFLTDFKAATAAKDNKRIMDLCSFPLESGQKQSDFIDEIDMYFDDITRKAIADFKLQDITEENGNKQIRLNLVFADGENEMESMVLFKLAKKGDSYKIISVDMAG